MRRFSHAHSQRPDRPILGGAQLLYQKIETRLGQPTAQRRRPGAEQPLRAGRPPDAQRRFPRRLQGVSQGEDQGGDLGDVVGVEMADDQVLELAPGQRGTREALKRAGTAIHHHPGPVLLDPVTGRGPVGVGDHRPCPHRDESHQATASLE